MRGAFIREIGPGPLVSKISLSQVLLIQIFSIGPQHIRQKQHLHEYSDSVKPFQYASATTNPLKFQHDPLVSMSGHLDVIILEVEHDLDHKHLAFLPQGFEPAICEALGVLFVRCLKWLERHA